MPWWFLNISFENIVYTYVKTSVCAMFSSFLEIEQHSLKAGVPLGFWYFDVTFAQLMWLSSNSLLHGVDVTSAQLMWLKPFASNNKLTKSLKTWNFKYPPTFPSYLPSIRQPPMSPSPRYAGQVQIAEGRHGDDRGGRAPGGGSGTHCAGAVHGRRWVATGVGMEEEGWEGSRVVRRNFDHYEVA